MFEWVLTSMLFVQVGLLVYREYLHHLEKAELLRSLDRLENKLLARDLPEYLAVSRGSKTSIRNPLADRIKERLEERSHVEAMIYESREW